MATLAFEHREYEARMQRALAAMRDARLDVLLVLLLSKGCGLASKRRATRCFPTRDLDGGRTEGEQHLLAVVDRPPQPFPY